MVVVAGVVGIIALIPLKMVVAICLGLGIHLILDALNGGVQLLWPKKERWVLGRHAVYGPLDRLLMVGGMVVTVGCLLVRLNSEMTTMTGYAGNDGQMEQSQRQ
jgi:membrane-bound metal-dependent hydrolase YbcI (DUF457 family)